MKRGETIIALVAIVGAGLVLAAATIALIVHG
jgi:hypothetical protein